jgi:hypothetical protein
MDWRSFFVGVMWTLLAEAGLVVTAVFVKLVTGALSQQK